jgi:hypothetical protein
MYAVHCRPHPSRARGCPIQKVMQVMKQTLVSDDVDQAALTPSEHHLSLDSRLGSR